MRNIKRKIAIVVIAAVVLAISGGFTIQGGITPPLVQSSTFLLK